jgi:hypothetical protein
MGRLPPLRWHISLDALVIKLRCAKCNPQLSQPCTANMGIIPPLLSTIQRMCIFRQARSLNHGQRLHLMCITIPATITIVSEPCPLSQNSCAHFLPFFSVRRTQYVFFFGKFVWESLNIYQYYHSCDPSSFIFPVTWWACCGSGPSRGRCTWICSIRSLR